MAESDVYECVVVYVFCRTVQTVFHSIDHHWSANVFATCGHQVDVWDEERAEPLRSFTWGVDSISNIKFNPVEVCLTSSCFMYPAIVLLFQFNCNTDIVFHRVFL